MAFFSILLWRADWKGQWKCYSSLPRLDRGVGVVHACRQSLNIHAPLHKCTEMCERYPCQHSFCMQQFKRAVLWGKSSLRCWWLLTCCNVLVFFFFIGDGGGGGGGVNVSLFSRSRFLKPCGLWHATTISLHIPICPSASFIRQRRLICGSWTFRSRQTTPLQSPESCISFADNRKCQSKRQQGSVL